MNALRNGYGALIPQLEVEMKMKFLVKKTSNGEYRFNLVASNGQTVATSETYKEKRSALATIDSIKKNASTATTDDQAA